MQPFPATRKPFWRRRPRRGIVLVMAALLLVALLGLCALTVDIGNLYVAKAELQRSADAAALAAAAGLIDTADLNTTPNPPVVATAARNRACEYVARNLCRSVTLTLPRNDDNATGGDLLLGHYNSTMRVFDRTSTRYNGVFVRTRRDAVQNGPVPLYVAPVLGVHQAAVTAESAAYIETDVLGFCVTDQSPGTCKLLPFTLQIGEWAARYANRIDDYVHNKTAQTVSSGQDGIYEVNIYPGRNSPGNFGTIDIGNTNNSTAELSRQIRYGPNASDMAHYPNSTLQFDANGVIRLNGDTGISAGIKDDLAAIIGQPRVLPLYSVMGGNGNNANYDIVAFVGVTVVAVKLTGANESKYVKLQPSYVVDDTVVGGGREGTTSKFVRSAPRLMLMP